MSAVEYYAATAEGRLRNRRPPAPKTEVSQTKNNQRGLGKKGKWGWIF